MTLEEQILETVTLGFDREYTTGELAESIVIKINESHDLINRKLIEDKIINLFNSDSENRLFDLKCEYKIPRSITLENKHLMHFEPQDLINLLIDATKLFK